MIGARVIQPVMWAGVQKGGPDSPMVCGACSDWQACDAADRCARATDEDYGHSAALLRRGRAALGESTSDEVSYSDYRQACYELANCAIALKTASPDEAAEHYLPLLTRCVALIFSFVGANMTARHVPRYHRTVAELQAAKDVQPATDAGTLTDNPT